MNLMKKSICKFGSLCVDVGAGLIGYIVINFVVITISCRWWTAWWRAAFWRRIARWWTTFWRWISWWRLTSSTQGSTSAGVVDNISVLCSRIVSN